jgi:hypothetical protein
MAEKRCAYVVTATDVEETIDDVRRSWEKIEAHCTLAAGHRGAHVLGPWVDPSNGRPIYETAPSGGTGEGT